MLANGREHQFRLRAARRFGLPGPLLEFAISAAGDGEKVIKPRKKIMFAVVPPLGALLQDVVVILFRLFDETFQADVTSDFVTLLVEREQREQAGDATVALRNG